MEKASEPGFDVYVNNVESGWNYQTKVFKRIYANEKSTSYVNICNMKAETLWS